MKPDDNGLFLVGAALGLCLGVFGMSLFAGAKMDALRVQAIEAGVAERTIDQQTGEVGFRFVKPECP